MISFQNKQTLNKLNTLFILLGFFISSLTYAQTETISICVGESVDLSKLKAPPAVDDYRCDKIIRDIVPYDETISRVDDDFMLSPGKTTTYTITSHYGPQNPKDNCGSGSKITQIVKVVVENCLIDSMDDIVLCTGQSAILGDLIIPATGPQPPSGTNNCNNLIRIIEPNDANVTKVGDNFLVSPNSTTTYTITSYYGSSDSTIVCFPVSEIIQTYRVLVTNCEQTMNTINIAKVDTICNGESLDLTYHMVNTLNYDCWQCNAIELQNETWLVDGVSISNQSTITVSPSETTEYTFTAVMCSSCAPIESCFKSEASPAPCNFVKYTRKVIVEDCNPSSDEVFEDYPWLTALVNPNSCTNETITVYKYRNYKFIYIQNDYAGDLYFQNGTFYCSDSPGYSCVTLYNLNEVESIWSCNEATGDSICELPADPGPCDVNRRRFYYDAAAGDCLTFQYGGCEGNANNFTSYFVCMENTCVEEAQCPEGDPLEWDWIQDVVTNSDGCPNRVEIFEGDGTTYVLLAQNGQLCDNDLPNEYYSCNGNYICFRGGNAFPGADDGCTFGEISNSRILWEYDKPIIKGCTIPEACNYNPEANLIDASCIFEGCDNEKTVFDDYPWLSTYVNQNSCSNEIISVYNYGSNSNFIYVQAETGNHLFYQDGTYYCSDEPGYSCLGAYGLDAIADFWSCEDVIVDPCYTNDPLSYPWIKEVINSAMFDPCTPREIEMFNYKGNSYFKINYGNLCDIAVPGGGSNILDCEGKTYCTTIANVTCNNEILEAAQSREVIWSYETTNCNVENPISDLPWISAYINKNILKPIKISMYYYNYETVFLINTSNDISEGEIYDCESRLYCSLENCVEFYEEATFIEVIYNTFYAEPTFDFAKYPWLNTIVNPIDCNEQPQITEYEFRGYAFIYVKTIQGGSLYLNDGTFYCSDEDGQTCLGYYNLTEPTTAWACNNEESFQKFDYVYTICEGESVELFGLSETVYLPCDCLPCNPVDVSDQPKTIWYPPSGTCSEFCNSFTVSPTSTTNYISTSEKITSGASSICGPAPPTLSESIIKHYLVIVETCSPAKTALTEQSQEKILSPTLKLYPNPTSDKVFIDLENSQDKPTQITLLDMQGKALQIIEASHLESKAEMDVSNYASGIYLIEIKNNDQTFIEKLIVE